MYYSAEEDDVVVVHDDNMIHTMLMNLPLRLRHRHLLSCPCCTEIGIAYF